MAHIIVNHHFYARTIPQEHVITLTKSYSKPLAHMARLYGIFQKLGGQLWTPSSRAPVLRPH